MRIIEKGDFTVYRHDGGHGNDIIVRPCPTAGAEVIFLFSLFMDYGHCLNVIYITEEEYRNLNALGDNAMMVEDYTSYLYSTRP